MQQDRVKAGEHQQTEPFSVHNVITQETIDAKRAGWSMLSCRVSGVSERLPSLMSHWGAEHKVTNVDRSGQL